MPRTAADEPAPRDDDARAARRDRRRAAIVLAIVLPVLFAGGCGSTAVHPAAEVVDAGPDCLADDVLWGLGLTPPEGHDRPAPGAGSVPADFEPVAVVECRGGLGGPVEIVPDEGTAPEELVAPGPGLVEELARHEVDLLDPETAPAPPPAGPTTVTVVETELHGRLGPLLTALARPSRQAGPGQVCTAWWELKPQAYLVDAGGRAVRVAWPTDECGFLLDDVTAPLADLDVVRETPRTTEDP